MPSPTVGLWERTLLASSASPNWHFIAEMIPRRSTAIHELIDLADRKNAMVLLSQERQISGFCFERRGMWSRSLAIGTLAIRAACHIFRLAYSKSCVKLLRPHEVGC